MELAGYFPYIPKDGSMSEEERLHHLSTLYRESEKIKTRFTSLIFHLQKELETNNKLVNAINLLIFYKDDIKDAICDCDSIALLLRTIRKFVSFYDYKLLKILAKHLGSSEIKKKFKKYKSHFQEFSKRHICECPSDLFQESETAEKPGKVHAIVIDKSMEKLSLEDLKNLLCKMNEVLGQKFLKVVKIEKGYVEVRSLDFVISDEQQRALSSLGVTTISCDGESVYSSKKSPEFPSESANSKKVS